MEGSDPVGVDIGGRGAKFPEGPPPLGGPFMGGKGPPIIPLLWALLWALLWVMMG
jgi:hypothetical protein